MLSIDLINHAMNKVNYFHGISSSNFNRLINSEGKQSGPWTVSDCDNLSYLWQLEYLINAYGFDPEEFNIENDIESILSIPSESAIIQCAMQGENEFYVLCVAIPDDYNSIDSDYSCENMHGAYCIPENDLLKFTAGYIKCNWNKWNSPIVIKGLIDRPLFNSSMVDSAILEIANALQDGIYSDTAFEFTLGEFTAIDYKG